MNSPKKLQFKIQHTVPSVMVGVRYGDGGDVSTVPLGKRSEFGRNYTVFYYETTNFLLIFKLIFIF